ncbi:hypothetical protein OB13_20365 [Pontibacter sp. HJ8]
MNNRIIHEGNGAARLIPLGNTITLTPQEKQELISAICFAYVSLEYVLEDSQRATLESVLLQLGVSFNRGA